MVEFKVGRTLRGFLPAETRRRIFILRFRRHNFAGLNAAMRSRHGVCY
jgi:hypothetical protein